VVAAALALAAAASWGVGDFIGGIKSRGLAPIAVLVVGGLATLAHVRDGVNVRADEDLAFFGPLGGVLVLPLVVRTLAAHVRRRRVDVRAVALAAALPLFVVELALAYRYNDWIGRFMVVPVALTAPLVASAYSARRLAAGLVAVAGLSLFATIAFNEQKPVGLAGTRPVWELGRDRVETIGRPRLGPVVRLVNRRLPARTKLGLVLGADDWSYPFYGASLERRIVYLRSRGALAAARRAGIADVLFARGKAPRASSSWTVVAIGRSGWKLASARPDVREAIAVRTPSRRAR
jgi:hypothetical protein